MANDGTHYAPISLKRVQIEGGFWGPRLETLRHTTIPAIYDRCRETGRIDAFTLSWKPGMPKRPHQFWDSDVAKWLEAACYVIATHEDESLRDQVDEVVALIENAQKPDGYLNTYYTTVEEENRWTNLRDMHELYCAGHLIEAALAHHEATGSTRLLGVARRYADHINSVFGRARGQKRGYPGHEEIELALVGLYRATQARQYLKLARYFVDERGRRPHYFDEEALQRGERPAHDGPADYTYCQAHLPVLKQFTAEGHAVRAMYLYSAMADLAAETGDGGLRKACETLWENVTQRRMYVTGGVGSSRHGERFTFDYDLPNETAYAETCAAAGLLLWAHRMLRLEVTREYADVMERVLYNGLLSGLSLDGRHFFYSNPLAAVPRTFTYLPAHHVAAERQEWFECACCPPNLARILASLGRYIYGQAGATLYVHLFVQGTVSAYVNGSQVQLEQRTEYPWDDHVRFQIDCEEATEFTLAVRIPGWCRDWKCSITGRYKASDIRERKGYVYIHRIWQPRDVVEFRFAMPVERVYAHPHVRMNANKIALHRGPVVFCLEEVDNGPDLAALHLPSTPHFTPVFKRRLLGGVTVITGRARRPRASAQAGDLYGPVPPRTKQVPFIAVPYFAWGNRGLGEMLVWLHAY